MRAGHTSDSDSHMETEKEIRVFANNKRNASDGALIRPMSSRTKLKFPINFLSLSQRNETGTETKSDPVTAED